MRRPLAVRRRAGDDRHAQRRISRQFRRRRALEHLQTAAAPQSEREAAARPARGPIGDRIASASSHFRNRVLTVVTARNRYFPADEPKLRARLDDYLTGLGGRL